ncbi:MAG: transporter [Muribaculaceae bacterium]|nr:transporter [Muribaculaceae bacterium]
MLNYKSIVTFVKNWTLPCAIVTGTVLYLVFANVEALDGAARFFDPIFDAIFPLFMGMILFTTFCKVDFHKMRPTAWHWWISLLQVLLVALVSGLIMAMEMKGRDLILMEGILTCIIAPGAAAAAVVTAKLGGNLESMTSYTFLSNFVTAVMVPLVFPLIDRGVDISFLEAFFTILWKVCMVLLVPMVAAYLVKHYLHRLHAWLVSIEDLSFYMWAISLSIVTGSTVKYIVHADTTVAFVLTIAVISLVLCLVQFALGRWVGHYFDATIESGQGLGQKNTAFAVWIAYTYLNPLCSVGPGCYILWQNAINSLEIWHVRKLKMQDASCKMQAG